MSYKKIFIIGSGIAGLSAAYYISLLKKNYKIEIFEASKFLGGRLRSFYDEDLDLKVDNGNHLCLNANSNIIDIIDNIAAKSNFDFYDPDFQICDAQESNFFKLNSKYLSILEKLCLLKFLMFPVFNKTVEQCFKNNKYLLYRLINPLCRSILNTPTNIAHAKIFKNVILKILSSKAKKPAGYFFPKDNWDDALIKPLSGYLETSGIKIHRQKPILQISTDDNGKATQIISGKKKFQLQNGDSIILATPANAASGLISGLGDSISIPKKYQPIINIHFKFNTNKKGVIGVIGSKYVEWIFFKRDHISITISAAEEIVSMEREELAQKSWEVCKEAANINKSTSLPEYKIIKEKRATFECSEDNLKMRPKSQKTNFQNLYITGDYIENRLPSTIEGTILNSKNLVKSYF